jgi:hypothetical protein
MSCESVDWVNVAGTSGCPCEDIYETLGSVKRRGSC